ncbi:MAG: mercuric reductase [Caldilineaceae bacterium]|nr:mercuric reductase [Caldilineaceae bacterium]
MTNRHTHDALIIGVGQAGNSLARALAGAGWKTAVIERRYVGGACVNDGCTPTKTMIASARVAYLARRGMDYGVEHNAARVDLAVVRRRKARLVEDSRHRIQRAMDEDENIDFIQGEARFVAPQTVEARLCDGGEQTLSAPHIVINSGARPMIPAIPGLDAAPFLDSTTIMELDKTPRHLLVLGGGYIGLEFGQMFRRFGAEVTIVHRGRQLLGREDADIADAVAAILREDGIEVLLQANTVRVAPQAGGGVALTAQTPAGERTLAGSHLLVATGRTPNVEALNLATAGVDTTPKGFIQVNERLETSAPGVYAAGDVNGGPAFTHIAYDDFRILRHNLLERGNDALPAVTMGRQVPYTVFIDPQLGRIGLTEREARRQGRRVRIAKMPMSHVARALEMDETRGLIKVVVDAESDQLLGAAVLGVEGGELATQLQIAMLGKLPYPILRDAIFPHPGLAEAFNNLFTYNLE